MENKKQTLDVMGQEAVLLEEKSGGFSTSCLEIVRDSIEENQEVSGNSSQG